MCVSWPEGDRSDVNVAIAHRHQAQVFLVNRLARGGELGRGAQRRALGSLPAGVGVNLRIEHQDIDIMAHRQDMIEAAKSDVVGPAIAADEPDRLLDQVFGQLRQSSSRVRRSGPVSQGAPRCACMHRLRLPSTGRHREFPSPARRRSARPRCQQLPGLATQVVDAQPQAQTKLGVVFKE